MDGARQMTPDIAAIRREFAALSDALAELRAERARHGETRLSIRGWWPVDRRKKAERLGLLETRLERLSDVVKGMEADGVYPSKKQKEDGRRGLRNIVRANPVR